MKTYLKQVLKVIVGIIGFLYLDNGIIWPFAIGMTNNH